jgi:outer membrane protein assembly factor BamB
MKRSFRTRAGRRSRRPGRVSALVLAAAFCSAFVLSAGAAPQRPAARTAVNREIQGTSALPPPRLVVHHRSSRDAPGYIFIAPKQGQTAQGPEIVDEQGRPVWFQPGGEASDFRVQSYLGKPVMTWYQGGIDYIVDSSYHVVATVHAGNGLDLDGHEFALTPQGTALVTIFHGVPFDLSSIGGPKDGIVVDGIVQQIDVATGRVLFEWHSLEHVPLDESYLPVNSDPDSYDYFHINAVNLDSDGNLLISGRHTWTIYKVDRQTGRILWRLGGKRSKFTLGSGVRFAWQHNPLPAGENTIRLFDNENNGEPGGRIMAQSRVIWVDLDTATLAATLVKAITHPAALSVPAQGNAQALANGDTFVGWGELGRVSEFDPQGKLVFDATLPGSDDTYRGYRFQWSGHPDTLPTAIARHAGRRKTTVHAIWNGATEVARWRILAGGSAAKLSPVRTAAWNGLDTAIKIAGTPKEVQLVALDARGSVIATSKPVRSH